MSKLLIISTDIISENMAGPGIRYWELANVLKSVVEVSLAVPAPSNLSSAEVPLVYYSQERPEALKTAALESDILLVAGYTLRKFPFLVEMDVPIIVDMYGPFLLENLEIRAEHDLPTQMYAHQVDVQVINGLLKRGDFFLCANEQQRDFWLGMLAANNRLNPGNYELDKTFDHLIAIVPFGILDTKPVHTKTVLKGVHQHIAVQDQLLLWGGGIWDWLDPLTLIKAFAGIVKEKPNTKLFFLGTQHPHTGDVPPMRMVQAAYELAKSTGLLNTHIFFNPWVAYEERHNYLLEADVGVSLHYPTIETHFSYRTRILDYIWAGLPILTTEGDDIAKLVETEKLGRVVPVSNVPATQDALRELLALQPNARELYGKNFERLANKMTWEQISTPLINFCRNPRRAPDYAVKKAFQPSGWKQRLGRAWRVLQQEGWGGVTHLIRSYLKWQLR